MYALESEEDNLYTWLDSVSDEFDAVMDDFSIRMALRDKLYDLLTHEYRDEVREVGVEPILKRIIKHMI